MWSQQASTFVSGVDTAFWLIFAISVICLLGITVFMIYCAMRFSRKNNPKATQIHGSWTLEFIWTIIPTFLVLGMFYFGWRGYIQMRRIPEDAMKITVNAGKWYWKFTYPNGMEQNNDQGLTVPLGQPIQIDLVSDDVVHAFYVPAFRLKMDVMPKPEGAQINRTWFEATKIGSFDILCAEYCGLEHSQMLSKVHVIPQAEFETWVQETEKAVKAAAEENPGEALFQSKGCFACHTTDGTPRIGPSFKGLYGKQEQVLTNNVERTITVDEPYLINSMKNPNQDLVKGYQPVMPPQNLTDEEIQHLIQYIKSFSE